MINYADIRSAAIRLHACREVAARTQAELDAARKEWERQNETLILRARVAADEQRQAEMELRDLAIDTWYKRPVNKTLGPGVGIRVVTRVDYDARTALQWAKEHGMYLALDAKRFDKFAKDNPTELPFVTLSEEATATIAADLSKALAEADAEAQRQAELGEIPF